MGEKKKKRRVNINDDYQTVPLEDTALGKRTAPTPPERSSPPLNYAKAPKYSPARILLVPPIKNYMHFIY